MDNQPVTRAQLVEALTSQKAEILEAVLEAIRGTQTEILKAFLPYQDGTGIRLRAVEAAGASVHERMAVVERRLGEIERKLLLNPPAA